jgi:hypothetical protein
MAFIDKRQLYQENFVFIRAKYSQHLNLLMVGI